MEIIRKEEGDVSFYTVAITGQTGMSQNGLARLAGIDPKTLRNLEDTLRTFAPSEHLRPFVGKDLTLRIDNPRIEGKPQGNLKIYKSSYCAAVLGHYSAREEEEKPPERPATYSLVKFAQMGIDRWIQDITGWTEYKDSIRPHTSVYIQRIENMRDHQIDDEHWAIFREAADLLLLLEKDWQVPINDFDLLDGSIGKRWRQYREGQPWAELNDNNWYTHNFRDNRGPRDCRAYKWAERPYFERWLRTEYVPRCLPAYLVDKYGKSVTRLIYTENGLLNDEILLLTEVKRKSPADEQKLQDFLIARQLLQLPLGL
ncbi:MAG TPA: hypothetical protein V6D29_25850 [Leptolyngbyaceae cyanobacterium]